MTTERRITDEKLEAGGKLNEGDEKRQDQTPDVEGHIVRLAPSVDQKHAQKHNRRF